jgi:hypothetical protein
MLRGSPVIHGYTNHLGLCSHFIKIAVIKRRCSGFDAKTSSVNIYKHRGSSFSIRDLQEREVETNEDACLKIDHHVLGCHSFLEFITEL